MTVARRPLQSLNHLAHHVMAPLHPHTGSGRQAGPGSGWHMFPFSSSSVSSSSVSSSSSSSTGRSHKSQASSDRKELATKAMAAAAAAEERGSMSKGSMRQEEERVMSPRQRHFLHYEAGEYRKQLAELDASLASALPRVGEPFRTQDLVYKSSGTPVRFLFELPIPVDMCGSHVSYRFATDEWDIAFGVFFQGVDGKMETVLPTQRVEAQYEPVAGDIHVHRKGTVILLWDNSYSWFATKSLAYTVQLRYPTGASFEQERMQRARHVVDGAYADIEQAATKQTTVKQERGALVQEVGKLEERLALLQAEVEEKRRELHTLEEDEALLDATLAMRKGYLLPVLFRGLPVKTLLHLFGYLGPREAPSTTATSKLWLHLYLQSRPGFARPPEASPVVRVQEEMGEVVEGEK